MSKRKIELTPEDKIFIATTMSSMVMILKTRLTDAQIKAFVTKQKVSDICKLIDEFKGEI